MSPSPALRALARLLVVLTLLASSLTPSLAEDADAASDAAEIVELETTITEHQQAVDHLLANIQGYQNIITQWDLITRRFTEFKSSTNRAVESCTERLAYLDNFEKEHPHLKGDPETTARRHKCNALLGSYKQKLQTYFERLSIIELEVGDFKAFLERDTGDLDNERVLLENSRAEKSLRDSLAGFNKSTEKTFGT